MPVRGLEAFIIHAWNDMKKRTEPVVGDTFHLLWLLKREMTPGNKWIDLLGVAETHEPRTLSVRDFIAAYDADLIPSSRAADRADP